MARYAATVKAPGSAAEVFAYFADFSSTAEWDPGVTEARRLNPDPLRAGARFHVVATPSGGGSARVPHGRDRSTPPSRAPRRDPDRGLGGHDHRARPDGAQAPRSPTTPAWGRGEPCGSQTRRSGWCSGGSVTGRKPAWPQPLGIASAARGARVGAPVRIGIVGGGISGLLAARRAARAGQRSRSSRPPATRWPHQHDHGSTRRAAGTSTPASSSSTTATTRTSSACSPSSASPASRRT